MITIFPTFFPSFACKADKCRHTCCQKWEIDIDEDTARKYRHTSGPLGDELRAWMTTGDEGSTCFRLNDQGYCHFLNEKGLCRLILEMGPSSLCQICRDHPRFYKFTYDSQREEDVTLAGTGLACEETVEQLLAEEGEMVFAVKGEKGLLSFEDLLSRLSLSLPRRLLHFHPSFQKDQVHQVLQLLEETNPIDREWTKSLSFMEDHEEELGRKAEHLAESLPPHFLTNLYRYIFYRQLDECEAYDIEDAACYSSESVTFILLEYARTGNLIRSVTRWSEQVEYDTENVYILLDRISEMDTPLDTPAE